MGGKRIEHVVEDGVEKKHCGRCKLFKELDLFPKVLNGKKTWDQLYYRCKECVRLGYLDRREAALEKGKEYHQLNRTKRLAYLKGWQKANPDRMRNYAKEKYHKDKSEGGEKFLTLKIVKNLRSRVWEAIKRRGASKCDNTFDLLGCDIDKFKAHLESHFEEGMSFSNYGVWHCDHNQPCVSFDMTNPLHVRACFHYKNLRPLWASDNCRKNAKYDPEEWHRYVKRYIETYVVM